MKTMHIPTLAEFKLAQERISDTVFRTPLVRLHLEDDEPEVYLKLENLQPIGSFKLRGAANAISAADPNSLKNGVFTASAGNMAQGVAWAARERGLACTVVVPDHAPETKLKAVERLGGRVIKVTFDQWWDVMSIGTYPGLDCLFIHPVSDQNVIAGNGTIGLEIIEDLPDVETIIIPFGGGGLSCGIASAARACGSHASFIASEVATAAPLTAAMKADQPVEVPYETSFVDGIGARGMLVEMWPLARHLIDDTAVVSLEQIAAAIRLMAERQRVIAEGAGASSLAAALNGKAKGKTVCVISGGNIDFSVLSKILNGSTP